MLWKRKCGKVPAARDVQQVGVLVRVGGVIACSENVKSFGAKNNKRRMAAAVQYLERVPVWSLLLALARPSPSSSYLQDERMGFRGILQYSAVMCESVSESVTISDLEIAIASPSFASSFIFVII